MSQVLDQVFNILGAVGITMILTKGKIFRPLREFISRKFSKSALDEVINCPMCLGVWIGLIWCFKIEAICIFNLEYLKLYLSQVFITSLLAYIIEKITDKKY